MHEDADLEKTMLDMLQLCSSLICTLVATTRNEEAARQCMIIIHDLIQVIGKIPGRSDEATIVDKACVMELRSKYAACT